MLELIIKNFLILWTTIDPPGTLALFVGMTSGMLKEDRQQSPMPVLSCSPPCWAAS
jgi:small neutral amino acid transporter SnatA (MarC family)